MRGLHPILRGKHEPLRDAHIVIVFSLGPGGEKEVAMVKWKGATKQLGRHLKQMALQKGITQAEGLGDFGELYAGEDKGFGVFNVLSVAHHACFVL